MTSHSPAPQFSGKVDSSPSGDAGSLHKGEPVFLAVGNLRRPHGLHGEIIMDVLTDFPERLHPGITLYVGPSHLPLRLHSLRWHGSALLVVFDGYETLEQAGKLRNHLAYVTATDLPPLPEGDYYHHQIIGLQVFSEQGEILGKVSEILTTGANDVYVVRPDIGKEILIPAVDEFVVAVDLESGRLRVRLSPGLLLE